MKLHQLSLAILSAVVLSACNNHSNSDQTVDKKMEQKGNATQDNQNKDKKVKQEEENKDEKAKEDEKGQESEKAKEDKKGQESEKAEEDKKDQEGEKDKEDEKANEPTATFSSKNFVQIKDGAAPAQNTTTKVDGNWYSVTVNGQEILLNPESYNGSDRLTSSSGTLSYSYNMDIHEAIFYLTDGSKDFSYGHVYSSKDPNYSEYFAVGNLTPESAKEDMKGQAVYNGNAFLENDTQRVLAKFRADVNFDDHNVEGSFSNLRPYNYERGIPQALSIFTDEISNQEFVGKSELGFSAEISGNQFKGQGAEGNFYGDKAQSIGGVIKNEKYMGSFGGSK